MAHFEKILKILQNFFVLGIFGGFWAYNWNFLPAFFALFPTFLVPCSFHAPFLPYYYITRTRVCVTPLVLFATFPSPSLDEGDFLGLYVRYRAFTPNGVGSATYRLLVLGLYTAVAVRLPARRKDSAFTIREKLSFSTSRQGPAERWVSRVQMRPCTADSTYPSAQSIARACHAR